MAGLRLTQDEIDELANALQRVSEADRDLLRRGQLSNAADALAELTTALHRAHERGDLTTEVLVAVDNLLETLALEPIRLRLGSYS